MRKILLIVVGAWMTMASVKADKLDLITEKEFRIGSESCTSCDTLNYTFVIKSDSMLVNEIVLAEGNKTKATFEVKEGTLAIYSAKITNGNSVNDMKGHNFYFKVGKSYTITWGKKTWLVNVIKKQPEVADLMLLNDSTIHIKEQELLKKTEKIFILTDSLLSISSIGFDEQYVGDLLIIKVADKDSIRLVYEGKIVKLAPPFELLKSKKYTIILKKNQTEKVFNIGEPENPSWVLWILIGGGVILVAASSIAVFCIIRKKREYKDDYKDYDGSPVNDGSSIDEIGKTGNDKTTDGQKLPEIEKSLADDVLTELIGQRIGFDLSNKQACVDTLKRMLNEYDVVEKMLQKPDLELMGESLKDKLKDPLEKYKILKLAERSVSRDNKPLVVNPEELSFAERLKLIGKEDKSAINQFVLDQLSAAGFEEIDYNRTQYTDYLQKIVRKLTEKSKNKEDIECETENKVRYILKQHGLDITSFVDDDVRLALQKTFLEKLKEKQFEGSTIEEVFAKVREKEAQLNKTINDKESEIREKQKEIETKQADIDNKEVKLEDKEAEITNFNVIIATMKQQLTDLFFADLDSLKEACNDVFLVACTNTSDSDCMATEDSFLNRLKDTIEKIYKIELTENAEPADRYKELQCILETELRNVDGSFNAMGRYYAYSRIPFMADDIEYGKKFKRNAMFKLFEAFDKLLTDFGLQVIIPHLFADTLADGQDLYEDYTGQKDAYSDLDNLCPNVKYRKEHVDYTDKNSLIYDIIAVGYSLNGQVAQKAKVLV